MLYWDAHCSGCLLSRSGHQEQHVIFKTGQRQSDKTESPLSILLREHYAEVQ